MAEETGETITINPKIILEKVEPMEPYFVNPSLLQYFTISETRNTKEEYEVLNGLFMGNHMYEETKNLQDVKLSKIIDLF